MDRGTRADDRHAGRGAAEVRTRNSYQSRWWAAATPRNDPRPIGDLLRAPDWMTERQKQIWAREIADAAPGLLKRCDTGTLVVLVVAEDRFQQAAGMRAQTRPVVKGSLGNPIMNPYGRVVDAQAAVILRAAGESSGSRRCRARGSSLSLPRRPTMTGAISSIGRVAERLAAMTSAQLGDAAWALSVMAGRIGEEQPHEARLLAALTADIAMELARRAGDGDVEALKIVLAATASKTVAERARGPKPRPEERPANRLADCLAKD